MSKRLFEDVFGHSGDAPIRNRLVGTERNWPKYRARRENDRSRRDVSHHHVRDRRNAFCADNGALHDDRRVGGSIQVTKGAVEFVPHQSRQQVSSVEAGALEKPMARVGNWHWKRDEVPTGGQRAKELILRFGIGRVTEPDRRVRNGIARWLILETDDRSQRFARAVSTKPNPLICPVGAEVGDAGSGADRRIDLVPLLRRPILVVSTENESANPTEHVPVSAEIEIGGIRDVVSITLQEPHQPILPSTHLPAALSIFERSIERNFIGSTLGHRPRRIDVQAFASPGVVGLIVVERGLEEDLRGAVIAYDDWRKSSQSVGALNLQQIET